MFSIVTATMNLAREDLEPILATYDAFAADGLAFELIVQDNGSSDAALTDLKRRSYVSLVTGTDTGIYDAWNQALPRVSGDWIGFLGIDDLPTQEWVAFAGSHAPATGISVLTCDVQMVDAKQAPLGVFANPRSGSLDTRANAFAHPGLAVARQVFDGRRFSDHYQIIGDLVFYAQFSSLPVVDHLGAIGVSMELGGISNSSKGARRVLKEYLRAVRRGNVQLHPPLLAKRLVAASLSLFPSAYHKMQRQRWARTGLSK